MRSARLIALGILLLTSLAVPLVVGARPGGVTIRLRRASFDPLAEQPAAVSEASGSGSTLRLAQLDGPPDAGRLAALRAAGLEPLLYIPDNAFLVRAAADSAPQRAGLRWIGALPADYKLAADLSGSSGSLELRVVAAPDADVAALAAAITAAGGAVSGSYDGLAGASLAARLPAVGLAGLSSRDDVVWVERREAPRLLNDVARSLIGGSVTLGNATAELSAACRIDGADRCNTSESVDIAAAAAGSYTLRVRGASVAHGPQTFALAARVDSGQQGTTTTPAQMQYLYLPLVLR